MENPSEDQYVAPPDPIVHAPAKVAPGANKYNLLVVTAPNWMEVVLEDDAGKPVDRVRCRLKLDGAPPLFDKLDASGFLRMEGMFRGQSLLSFPDIDQEEWDVAGASPAAASSSDDAMENLVSSRFQPYDLPKEHIVAERETLRTIADQYGFQDWKRIYLHESNADLRTLRKHPGALQSGDRVIIPAKREKDIPGAYKQTHRFRLIPRTEILSLIVKDDDCVPYAQKRYELTVDGQAFSGKTDENGGLSHEAPLNAKKGALKVWIEDDPKAEPMTWSLNIGKVLPVEDLSGLQMRLNRLGFDAGPVTGQMNAKTCSALLALQVYLEFEAPNGEPTPETLQGILDLEEAIYEPPTETTATNGKTE